MNPSANFNSFPLLQLYTVLYNENLQAVKCKYININKVFWQRRNWMSSSLDNKELVGVSSGRLQKQAICLSLPCLIFNNLS